MNQPAQDGCSGSNPHEDKHLDAYLSLDVDRISGALDGAPEDQEHCRGNDGGDGGGEGRQKSQDGQREGCPARVDGQRGQEGGGKGEAGGSQEKSKHPMGSFADEGEGVGDVGRQGDGCTSEELAEENLDRIEPVHPLWFTAEGDLVAIAIAVAPKTDLVEVMQTQGPGDAVDQAKIRHRARDDIGQIELDEVDGGEDRLL